MVLFHNHYTYIINNFYIYLWGNKQKQYMISGIKHIEKITQIPSKIFSTMKTKKILLKGKQLLT